MADAPDRLPSRETALREDLNKEYYAILDVISAYDGRFLTIKGWSVTLSLAALGLGFQQQHYALFGLAAATALAFWFLDILMKGYQLHYYARMRDIEVACFRLNPVDLADLGQFSAPRIDMTWGYPGNPKEQDRRTGPPKRRDRKNVQDLFQGRYWSPGVFLPHAVAVVLGFGLFFAALLGVPWLSSMQP